MIYYGPPGVSLRYRCKIPVDKGEAIMSLSWKWVAMISLVICTVVALTVAAPYWASDPADEDESPPMGRVVAYELNIRASPDHEAEEVGKLYMGDEVPLLERLDFWYRIGEGQYVHSEYIVPIEHFGFIRPAAYYEGRKWIDINLTEQRLSAYEGRTVITQTLISSGLPSHPTPSGLFSVTGKVESRSMFGFDFDLPAVPWVLYFHPRGYAVHGTYWHNNFGHPMSHGCVNTPTAAAAWLYEWAEPGTPIAIHY
jgi:lipoprotein-anchoring transpeptidase ErfK/SrfK